MSSRSSGPDLYSALLILGCASMGFHAPDDFARQGRDLCPPQRANTRETPGLKDRGVGLGDKQLHTTGSDHRRRHKCHNGSGRLLSYGYLNRIKGVL